MAHPRTVRSAYTAIELLVVISVVALLAAMLTPAVLQGMRRGAVGEGAAAIREAWQTAQSLARRHDPGEFAGTPDAGRFFGVRVHQTAGGSAVVSVIFGTAAESDRVLRRRRDDPASEPAFARTLPSHALIGRRLVEGGPLASGDLDIVWYAQYRTGLPLAPADLALIQPPITAVGIRQPTGMAATVVLCRNLLVHTPDFSATDGHGVNVAIYHSGISAVEDVR